MMARRKGAWIEAVFLWWPSCSWACGNKGLRFRSGEDEGKKTWFSQKKKKDLISSKEKEVDGQKNGPFWASVSIKSVDDSSHKQLTVLFFFSQTFISRTSRRFLTPARHRLVPDRRPVREGLVAPARSRTLSLFFPLCDALFCSFSMHDKTLDVATVCVGRSRGYDSD